MKEFQSLQSVLHYYLEVHTLLCRTGFGGAGWTGGFGALFLVAPRGGLELSKFEFLLLLEFGLKLLGGEVLDLDPFSALVLGAAVRVVGLRVGVQELALGIWLDLWSTVLDPFVEDSVLLEASGHPAERAEGPRLPHLEEAKGGGTEAQVGEVPEHVGREEPRRIAGEDVLLLLLLMGRMS